MEIHKLEIRNQKCEMRNSKGFSLIELVFAMSFLTIIILGVISLQTSNLAMMNSQNNVIQAHFYANQSLQIVEAIGYPSVDSAYSGCGGDPCYKTIRLSGNNYIFSDTPELIGDVPFERTIEINPTDLTDAYKVTVLVGWEDGTGDHEILAKRIISQ